MKKRTIYFLIAAIAVSVMTASCAVFDNVMKQIGGLANLANCTYNLKNVSDIYVAGVSVKNVSNGNISVADVASLTTALLQKKVPLTMSVNVNVTNPTDKAAALTTMDWICEIDGREMVSGTTSKAYNISPNATTTVALPVSTDIYSLFSQGGINALKTFVQSFTGDGTNSSIKMKIKPSVNVGGVNIPSPQFITLEKKTGNTTTTTTNSNSNNNNNNNNNNGGSNRPTLQINK